VPEHHGGVVHEQELNEGGARCREDRVGETGTMHADHDLGTLEDLHSLGDRLLAGEDLDLLIGEAGSHCGQDLVLVPHAAVRRALAGAVDDQVALLDGQRGVSLEYLAQQAVVLLGGDDDGRGAGHQELISAVGGSGVIHLHVLRGDAQVLQPGCLVRGAEGQDLGLLVEEGAQQDDAGDDLLDEVVVHLTVLLNGGGQTLEVLAFGGVQLFLGGWEASH